MAYVGAGVAAAGLIYSAYSGERAAQQGAKARNRQDQAQKVAQAQAVSQERTAAQAQAQEAQKTPDLAAMLAADQKLRLGGGPGTLVSRGATGLDARTLKLGRSTLLGE